MTKPFLISSQKHFCFRQTVKLLFITVPWEKKLCLGNFFSKTFLLPVFSLNYFTLAYGWNSQNISIFEGHSIWAWLPARRLEYLIVKQSTAQGRRTSEQNWRLGNSTVSCRTRCSNILCVASFSWTTPCLQQKHQIFMYRITMSFPPPCRHHEVYVLVSLRYYHCIKLNSLLQYAVTVAKTQQHSFGLIYNSPTLNSLLAHIPLITKAI